MGNFQFLLIALLLVGVAKIEGDSKLLPGRLPTPADGCGLTRVNTPRIVGGSPAKRNAYPWMALIGYRNETGLYFRCGGTLISTRHVLTAAHCLLPGLYMVRLGEHDFENPDNSEYEARIVRAVPHEHYDKTLNINDIAILTLAGDVTFNDHIVPICLPVNGEIRTRSFVGQSPFIAGWGRTSEEGARSTVLLHAQVNVITNKDCKEKIRKTGALRKEYQFDTFVICAGVNEGGVDVCAGDSGGPLMLPVHENGSFAFYQLGIASYGIGCARRNSPGVYANIQYYATWIKFHLQ